MSGETFQLLAEQMLEGQCDEEVDQACALMSAFSKQHLEVDGWFRWWYKRRHHVCHAYKPTDMPPANVAEKGQSKMAARGKQYNLLLEVAYVNVISALRQQLEIRQFAEGRHTFGTGESVNMGKSKAHREGMRKAAAYATQIEAEPYSDVEQMDMPTDVVRPRARKSARKSQKATHDIYAMLSSDAEEVNVPDAEEVNVADSEAHRPRKVRKKVGSKNARQLTFAAAAEASTPSTQTCRVAANVRPTAGQNIPRRTSVAAGASSSARGTTFHMHLRTCRRRNVRLTSLSPQAAKGGTAAERNVTSVPVAATSVHRPSPQRAAANSSYHLWLKRPAVKTCYGCKQRFADCYNRPPKDIIIRRFMHRKYTDSHISTIKRARKSSAAYFHLNMDCIRKVTSSANVTDIVVHDEVWSLLLGKHVSRLQDFGMDILPDEDST